MASLNRDALQHMSVKDLKALLAKRGVSASGATEKDDLIDLALEGHISEGGHRAEHNVYNPVHGPELPQPASVPPAGTAAAAAAAEEDAPPAAHGTAAAATDSGESEPKRARTGGAAGAHPAHAASLNPDELRSKSIKELMAMLKERGLAVPHGATERDDLIDLLVSGHVQLFGHHPSTAHDLYGTLNPKPDKPADAEPSAPDAQQSAS